MVVGIWYREWSTVLYVSKCLATALAGQLLASDKYKFSAKCGHKGDNITVAIYPKHTYSTSLDIVFHTVKQEDTCTSKDNL